MEQTGFAVSVAADAIIYSDSTAGVVYTFTKSWGPTVPTNALVRNVWFLVTNAYQYSTHRYAKVVDVTFGTDMSDPFTTDGSSASSNVDVGFQVTMNNQRQSFQAITQFQARIRGAGVDSGYSDGAVFRILAGADINIFLNWEPAIKTWRKTGGVWTPYTPNRKFNGVWYEAMFRRKSGGVWQ